MPHATLENIYADTWSGDLLDHPGDLLVVVRQLDAETFRVALWGSIDGGRNPIGSGPLLRDGARLVGECDETEARRETKWKVSGDVGFARLEFRR